MKNSLLILFFFLFLVGCASVPMDTEVNDIKRKEFTPNPVRSGIYIFRNQTIRYYRRIGISIDDQDIGETLPKTYLFKEVDPGVHKITVNPNTFDEQSLAISTVVGKLYYIWLDVRILFKSKPILVDEEKGQRGINECKLAITK